MAATKNVRPRKVPMRQCMGCGEKKEKKELIRVIRTTEEAVVLDTTGRKNGRGAYLCNNVDCLHKAQKRKSIERALNMPIPEQIYQKLEKEMINHAD